MHDGEFRQDPLRRQNACRSVLYLSLLAQSKIRGIFTFENRLFSSVFTEAHISLLEMLSTQETISIENASLHTKLLLLNQSQLTEKDHFVCNKTFFTSWA